MLGATVDVNIGGKIKQFPAHVKIDTSFSREDVPYPVLTPNDDARYIFARDVCGTWYGMELHR